MPRLQVDTRELAAFGDVLARAGAEAAAGATAIVAKGAVNIKRDARAAAPHGPHTPHYRDAITYDQTSGPTGSEAEIGPEHERSQGPLGVIFEYGTVHHRPQPHLMPAADAEEPRFYAEAEALAARLTGRYG